jgi:ADP-heptose:LPS heptosyltransferase
VRAFARHVRALRAGRYEVALDLGRGAKSAALAYASGARRRLGFSRADAREGSWLLATEHLPVQGPAESKLLQCWRFGDLLGAPDDAIAFGLAPSAAEAERAAALLAGASGPVVAASLGSTCPSRRWWPERTAGVLDALARSHGTGSVLVGTRDDRAFADAVTAAMRTPVLDLTGATTLRELLAVLARVRLLVGPDSGALHLAAALGVPVVSLWGATSPTRSAPWGSAAWVVRGETPCAPCFLKHCPIERMCMRRLGAETVLDRAQAALAA